MQRLSAAPYLSTYSSDGRPSATNPHICEYLASLWPPLAPHRTRRPTALTPDAIEIKAAADSLAALPQITTSTLTAWASDHPAWVDVLGLAAGLSQEKLKNVLKHYLGTSGWITLARERPSELAGMLESQFQLVRLIEVQRNRSYDLEERCVNMRLASPWMLQRPPSCASRSRGPRCGSGWPRRGALRRGGHHQRTQRGRQLGAVGAPAFRPDAH